VPAASTRARQYGFGRERGAHDRIETRRGDRVVAGRKIAAIARKAHAITGPGLLDHRRDQVASGLAHIGSEERPAVMAAQRLLLFDQQQRAFGPRLAQGQGDQSPESPLPGSRCRRDANSSCPALRQARGLATAARKQDR
jgi:hypothetical protein